MSLREIKSYSSGKKIPIMILTEGYEGQPVIPIIIPLGLFLLILAAHFTILSIKFMLSLEKEA